MKTTYFFLLILAISCISNIKAQTAKQASPPMDLIRFLFSGEDGKEELKEFYNDNLRQAAEELTITQVDITGDKKPEYFVRSHYMNGCGNSVCDVTVYQRKGRSFVVLHSGSFLKVDLGWYNGMRNLVASSNVADDAYDRYYRWNGIEYIAYKCVKYNTFAKKPRKKQIPCSDDYAQ
jgi:hypothetical protein